MDCSGGLGFQSFGKPSANSGDRAKCTLLKTVNNVRLLFRRFPLSSRHSTNRQMILVSTAVLTDLQELPLVSRV